MNFIIALCFENRIYGIYTWLIPNAARPDNPEAPQVAGTSGRWSFIAQARS
jgi:hypothetical protein